MAVEYITSKGPASLDGQLFNFNSAPNGLGEFYELHVWAWKSNPTGTFGLGFLAPAEGGGEVAAKRPERGLRRALSPLRLGFAEP
ncbi:MAG: hypothetical protein E5V75_34830, partial [Mesorhizobium sp.]